MGLAEIVITVFGLGLSVFVIWFFFFSKRKAYKIETTSEGVQEVNIRVKGGYYPYVIVVKLFFRISKRAPFLRLLKVYPLNYIQTKQVSLISLAEWECCVVSL